MRARLIWTEASPEVIDAGLQITKDVLVPAARERDGFRGYIALFDTDRGVGLAVTLWEDEQTEQASDEASQALREQLAESVGAKVSVEKYDVAVTEFA